MNLTYPLALALCALAAFPVSAAPRADALTPPKAGDVRLDGRIGAALGRGLDARVYSDWARGAMYEEAVNAFRTHEDDKTAGWQNEYWGKTMLCVAGAIAYTGDRGLADRALAKAHAFTAELQKPNGYLSTYSDEDFLIGPTNRVWCFNVWGRKYTFWALVELHRATGDAACLTAARKMADHLIDQLARLKKKIWETGAWHGISSMSILRPMNELYRLTGEEKYLAFCREIIEGLTRAGGDEGTILANARTKKGPIWSWFPKPGYWAKAYETMSCLEGAADYLRLENRTDVFDGLVKYCQLLDEGEINPMRSAGHFDHFFGGGITFNGLTELCDVIHFIRLNREMLLLTGESKYADRLEEAFYNAFLAGVTRDGKWGAHIIRSHGTRHLWAPSQTGMMHHQCCPDNQLRGFFDFAGSAAATAADGTLSVILYSDGETRLGDATVVVRGGYPYAEGPVSVSVTSKCARTVRFRVPYWSQANFTVNGAKAVVKDGWCEASAAAGASAWLLRFDRTPRLVDVPIGHERPDNGKPYSENPRNFTQRCMTWRTPENQACINLEPASYVMLGPLVLAKGRLAGTSRGDTLFAPPLRGQYARAGGDAPTSWKVACTRLPDYSAATAGVDFRWRLTFTRGRETVEAVVSDFASVSNVEANDNWFSLWF